MNLEAKKAFARAEIAMADYFYESARLAEATRSATFAADGVGLEGSETTVRGLSVPDVAKIAVWRCCAML